MKETILIKFSFNSKDNLGIHLYSRLGQVEVRGQLLPPEDVRILRLRKGHLQLVQLVRGERRA